MNSIIQIVAGFLGSLMLGCLCMLLGSTSSYTIEGAGVWLDHAEGLPFSQFLGERRFILSVFFFLFLHTFYFSFVSYVNLRAK